MNEEAFQRWIKQYAEDHDWLVNHTRRAVSGEKNKRWLTATSVKGWPDLTLVRERIVYAEIKLDDTYPTPEQRRVLERLRRAGAEVYVWRPRNKKAIQRALA